MPRPVMRLLLIFVVAGLVGAADEWPQFRGNPQLTGVATGSVPANLKLLWSFDAGESIESSAAISGGTVYVGSQSKELLAIDLETGKLRWKYRAAMPSGNRRRPLLTASSMWATSPECCTP